MAGCTPSAHTHSLLRAAGSNWHLFDTIDFVKYSTGDTLHLPTSLLDTDLDTLIITEQMDIPGVSMPDLFNGPYISWGIIEETNIAYIYVFGWWDHYLLFEGVVDTIMHQYETSGLIIDTRYNFGGGILAAQFGLQLLFNTFTYTFGRGRNGQHILKSPQTHRERHRA